MVPAQARLEAHQARPARRAPPLRAHALRRACSRTATRSSSPTCTTSSPNAWARCASSSWTTPMAKGWFARKPGTVKVLYGLLGGPGARRRDRAHHPARGEHPRRVARRAGDRRRDPAADRGALDAEAHREGLRGAAPHARLQAVHRRIGEAPRRVRRAQEPLLRVPAVRRGVRRHQEVGEGVRRSRRRTARHVVVVRLATSARLRDVLERDRRLRGDELGHADVRRRRRVARAASAGADSPVAVAAVAAAAPGRPSRPAPARTQSCRGIERMRSKTRKIGGRGSPPWTR